MFKKLLRRAILLWCAWGLVRLAVAVNPLVAYLGHQVNQSLGHTETTFADDAVGGWVVVLIGAIALLVGGFVVHLFGTWLFDEREDERH